MFKLNANSNFNNNLLKSKFSLFFLIFFSIFLTLHSYALDYPDFTFDDIEEFGSEDEINITGEACYNCEVSLYINDELVEQKVISSNVSIIDWENTGNTIELHPNQKFRINYTPSSYNEGDQYELTIFDQEPVQRNVGELSEEFTYSSIDYEGSTIITNYGENIFGAESKTIQSREESKEFSFGPFTRDDFISGSNTIKIVVSGGDFDGALDDIEEQKTTDIDKYRISFNLDDSNVYAFNAEGGNIVGSVENVDDYDNYGFAYLINGPGEIINNVGLMRDFEVNESTGEFNISFSRISDLREGDNTIDLIAHESENKGIFRGFERVEITRDTQAPNVEINSVKLYNGGNVVNEFQAGEIGNRILTGYSTIEINVSADADELEWEYDSNPRTEVLINNQSTLRISAKRGDRLVRDISNDLSNDKNASEIIEERNVDEETVTTVANAYSKLQEEGIPRNSAWYREVANEFLIGNNLIITATDEAGNTARESFTIVFNDEDPELVVEEMEPNSIFEDGESFNGIERIQGRTNQPNVDVSFIVIGPDDYVQSESGNRQRISCQNAFEYYERGIWRNYEDTSTLEENNLDDNEVSTSLALQFSDFVELARGSLDFKSNSEGKFGASNIVEAVVEGNFISPRTGIDPDDRSAQHRNTLCAFMENDFGRTNMQTFNFNYLTGNNDWNVDGVSFNKNSINPYEIESAVDRSSRYRASVVIEMNYQGQFGETGDLDFNQVRVRKRGSEPRDVRVASSEVVYFYQNGRLNLYIPLEFSKRDIPVEDYPNTESIVLEITPRAIVQGYEIDNRNPEFVEFDVYYDTNLMTKWLTPKMIDKGIDFINETLKLTGDLRDVTRQLVPVGALTCTVAKFGYSLQASQLGPEENPQDREKVEELKQQLYMVCDRTFSSATPNKCDPELLAESDTLIKPGDNGNYETPDDLSTFDTYLEDDSNQVLERFTSLNVGRECDVPGGNGLKGRIVRGEVNKFDKLDYTFYQPDEAESTKVLAGNCVPYTYSSELDTALAQCEQESDAGERNQCRNSAYENDDYKLGVDTKAVRSSCYSEEAPRYDNTRCFGRAGMDPSRSIVDSLACGAIPDTYQHLNKLYKVQENIISCLEDVKSAKVEGTYCERLVSVSMCDAVTGVVFRLADQQQINSPPGREYDNDDNGILGVLNTLQSTDGLMDNRYGDQNFYSSGGGINTRSITNNLCLLGLTGDFAMFEQNVLGDIETGVEVDPEYTKTMPQTRFESHNPISGDMTISYKFTHNGISGGSPVRFNYELICDSAEENGEYCPEGRTKASEIDSSVYRDRQVSISAGSQAQELIEIRDSEALYVFNVLRTTVEFTVNDEERTRVHEEVIRRGPGDILGTGAFSSCRFSMTSGIGCQTQQFGSAGDLTYYTFGSNTKAAPLNGDSPVAYPGEQLGVNVFYSARGAGSNHRGTLWYKSSCGNEFGQVQLDERSISGTNGNFYTELFRIPDQLGQVQQNSNNNNNNQNTDTNNNQNNNNDGTTNNENVGFREGNCQLSLRMTGSDVQLTQDTFDKDILEEEGIQVDSNTASRVNQVYKTNFIVRSSLAEGEDYGVDLIKPLNEQTICVNNAGVPVDNGVIQVATYKDLSNSEVELQLDQYAQDPIKFTFVPNNNYENLYAAQYSVGQFSSIDFTSAQIGEVLVKEGEDVLTREEVRLKIC